MTNLDDLDDLDDLDELAAALAPAELRAMERYAHVAPRILDVPPLRPPFATALRIRLAVLRAMRDRVSADSYARRVTDLRERAESARERALWVIDRLDALLGERDRLRDRLVVYRAYARDEAFRRDGRPLEDGELAELHDRAADLLYHGLVDLDRARRRVRRYVDAVKRRFPEEG